MSVHTKLRSDSLKILMVAAEAVPFAKVGHVAEVVGSLPNALHRLGHDVRLVIPRYGRISPAKFDLKPLVHSLDIPFKNGSPQNVSVSETTLASGVPVYFVDNDEYFNRDGIYSYPDDDERFALFGRAVLEMLPEIGWQPDIIHCHDWHTAFIPGLLKSAFADRPFYQNIASVYTIHNLAYQGIFGNRVLEIAGIAEQNFVYPVLDDPGKLVSLMSLGIHNADVISTVSPTYAQEILTPKYGENMDKLLLARQDRLFGILNGIDDTLFNPETDPYLAVNFNADGIERRLENKLDLQHHCDLPREPGVPIMGMITRLANQKGLDLLSQIVESLLEQPVQFVLMGTGDPLYHEEFSRVAARHPDQMKLFLTFNAVTAQKIYGGSDLFLMPSRFEPCGLGQMIAMRYGSIPVVRKTGGLADTVQDYNPATGEGNGFTFTDYEPTSLYEAINRALDTYQERAIWQKLVRHDMQADYSWNASAREYVKLYQKAISVRGN